MNSDLPCLFRKETYPSEQAAEALRYLAQGRPFGRVALTI